MKRILVTALMLVLPGLAAAQDTPADPEPGDCLPVADGLANLKANYNEDVRVTALRNDGGMLIITAGPDGNWSAVVVDVTGIACLAIWGPAIAFEDALPLGADM